MLTQTDYQCAGILLGILSSSLPAGHLTMHVESGLIVHYRWRFVKGDDEFGWQVGIGAKRFYFEVGRDVDAFAQNLIRDMREHYDSAKRGSSLKAPITKPASTESIAEM